MTYKFKVKNIEVFQYTGDLMDSKGKWCVPDWAVYMYQQGQLYFYAEKPFLPPTELYYRKDKDSLPIHIQYEDYVIKLDDSIYVMDKQLFEIFFEKE